MAKKNDWKRRIFEYDSKWEKELNETVFKGCNYHPCKINYVTESTYQPDWSILKGDRTIYIEAKGHFRDNYEMKKYKWIRKALTDYEELVFVFQKPNAPIHFRAKRKDGTKQTNAQWAELNNFRWFTEETVKDIL